MNRPENIPQNSKFLYGVGESAWFYIERTDSMNEYRIVRYSVLGEMECSYLSELNNSDFDIKEEFELTYVSHCMKCTVLQNNITFVFSKIG